MPRRSSAIKTPNDAGPHAASYRALHPNVRVTSPQPFAPRVRGRFARVRGARQSADWLRARPPRAPALSAPVRRLRGRSPARLALARSVVPWSSALAAAPRVRPRPWRWRVRSFRGRPRLPPRRASAPVPPLRARGTTFGFLYDAAARRLHLPCRPAAMRILCGINLKCCFLPLGSLFLRTLPNILRLDMRLSVERLSGPCARTG